MFGKLDRLDVAVMAGRAICTKATRPRRSPSASACCTAWACGRIVFTNAAGGINLSYRQGALVLISDHINLQGIESADRTERRFARAALPGHDRTPIRRRTGPSRTRWRDNWKIQLDEGVYAALTGPSYETPAEIRYLRTIGADLVGMSTVPEVIVANYLGMRVLAISCVTNMAAGILPQKIRS